MIAPIWTVMPLDTTPETKIAGDCRYQWPRHPVVYSHYQEQPPDQPVLDIQVSEQLVTQALKTKSHRREVTATHLNWAMIAGIMMLAGVVFGKHLHTQSANAVDDGKTRIAPVTPNLDPGPPAILSDDSANLPQTPATDGEPLTLEQLGGGQIPNFHNVITSARMAVTSENFTTAHDLLEVAKRLAITPDQKAELNGVKLLCQRRRGFVLQQQGVEYEP